MGQVVGERQDWNVSAGGPEGAWGQAGDADGATSGQDEGRRWARIALEPKTSSVSLVRRWARDVADQWGAGDSEWVLSQLLTEVATNAVLHARTRFLVRLEQDLGSGRLRCEVADLSPARPRVRLYGPDATTGRGLQLLERLSAAWGVRSERGGKAVWFEVDHGASMDLVDDDLAAALADLADVDVAPSAVPSEPGRHEGGDVSGATGRGPAVTLGFGRWGIAA